MLPLYESVCQTQLVQVSTNSYRQPSSETAAEGLNSSTSAIWLNMAYSCYHIYAAESLRRMDVGRCLYFYALRPTSI